MNLDSQRQNSGTFLFASTDGVWRRPLWEMITDVEPPLPTHYALEQNYPNPFNPTTEIRYQTPVEDPTSWEVRHVTLKVFDILGREVATLVNGVEEAGYKSVQWNASNVASGVYRYRLQAGAFVETKKCLVLR